MNKPDGSSEKAYLSAGSHDLSSKLEEQGRLARFVSKLLGELFYLHGDGVSFVPEGERLAVCMHRGTDELKRISIRSSWFSPLRSWISSRPHIFADDYHSRRLPLDADGMQLDGDAACRFGSEIAVYRARTSQTDKGRESLILSSLRRVSMQASIDQLGMSGRATLLYEQIVASRHGLLIIAAPDAENLAKNVAAMRILTGLNYAGELGKIAAGTGLAEASKSELLLAAVMADDAISAIGKLDECALSPKDVPVCGVICQVFAPRTCVFCAQSAAAGQDLIERLPLSLRPATWDGYRAASGCERCSGSGARGLIGIQSILAVAGEISGLVASGADEAALLRAAYPLGTRSLLEDGMSKVLAGQITLGSLFTVVQGLPRVYAEHGVGTDKGTRSGAIPQPAKGGASSSPMRESAVPEKGKPVVLVVEDDADQRAILDMVFRASNYEVSSAENGKQALEMLRSNPLPDIIISDLMMPEMDGAEFVTEIRRDKMLQHIPILILTVVSDGEREYSLLDLGADDYVEKTVQRKILLKRAEKLLKRNRTRGQARTS